MARNVIKVGRRPVPRDVVDYVETGPRPPPVRGGGNRGITGLAPPDLQGNQGALMRFPASFAPPLGAKDFQASGNETVNGPTSAILAGSQFEIPKNSVGYIRSLTFNVNSLAVTSLISFTLLFNESPVPGWANISLFPRPAASVSLSYGPEETFIWIPDGQRISVRVRVQDGASYLIGTLYHGWHFSKSIAEQYGLSGR